METLTTDRHPPQQRIDTQQQSLVMLGPSAGKLAVFSIVIAHHLSEENI